MKSIYISGYLPYLLVIALFTGFATGSAAAGILRVLIKMPMGIKIKESN